MFASILAKSKGGHVMFNDFDDRKRKKYVVEFQLANGDIWSYSLSTAEECREQIEVHPESDTHFRTYVKTLQGNHEQLTNFSVWLPVKTNKN